MDNLPKFQPSFMVLCHKLNVMILKEKDETIKQDLINQYNEIVNNQYDMEKRVFDFQFNLN
jgi:hypothetical protein